MMIVTVFYVSKHITERVSAFAEQLECPDLVEPQIILCGEYAHNRASNKGSDCHPQHECMQRRALRRTWYFHKDAVALSWYDCEAGVLVGFG
jgi:hypothetical protein